MAEKKPASAGMGSGPSRHFPHSASPPPLLPPEPRHYISGHGLGIRPMNAIRRNLVYPAPNPIGRYATFEPIPLPLGLDHLYHLPTQRRVNGGKGKLFGSVSLCL